MYSINVNTEQYIRNLYMFAETCLEDGSLVTILLTYN